MSITPETIHAIQQAGQALDAARAALQQASQQQSARVAEALGANPFGLENDAHFEHWKSIARMAQALQAMEEQLRTVFQTASEIAFDHPVAAAAGRARPPLRLPAAGRAAEVVDAVPAKARRAARSKPASRATAAPPPPKGNAGRVQAYLVTVLNRRGFTRVTHGEVVAGAGIPLGSVGAALTGLKNRGLLREGERGSYQLV
ncbi:hypothetical protein [Pseudorhodoferax sp.]|uniref:hypothetical protein n=1 Tax=Pseudorhodoferax sp. TaxID=1993553 RepID=UPI002DD6907D|nr:hypothetical protein [Pseudorhodoferax sp.]